MADKKLRVYCETSFWSYLNGRPTPLQHIAVKQAATLHGGRRLRRSAKSMFLSTLVRKPMVGTKNVLHCVERAWQID